MPAAYIKPYVKRGKNDAVDAAAVCEAMSRPGMRFAPIKSADQQAVLMLHKTRELLIKQRTMSVNALRGHLAEFGLIAPKGVGRVSQLLELADADAAVPEEGKDAVKLLALHLEGLDRSIEVAEKKIAAASAGSRTSQLLDLIPGVGPLIASAIAASVPDPGVFKSGRDFAAWLGLTPRQNSTGGKEKLGAITKQGNRYLRKMLVGCTSALRVAANATAPRRLDRGVASEKAGALGRGGARQQAGENLLGDHDHRRSLPPGDLRQGVESLIERPSRVWRAQRDVMNDMGRSRTAEDNPRIIMSVKLVAMIRDRGCRTSSGPAAISAAQIGRTYDRSRPVRSKRQKTACQTGPSTYDDFIGPQRALVS